MLRADDMPLNVLPETPAAHFWMSAPPPLVIADTYTDVIVEIEIVLDVLFCKIPLICDKSADHTAADICVLDGACTVTVGDDHAFASCDTCNTACPCLVRAFSLLIFLMVMLPVL